VDKIAQNKSLTHLETALPNLKHFGDIKIVENVGQMLTKNAKALLKRQKNWRMLHFKVS
jgi:hypothetical protein